MLLLERERVSEATLMAELYGAAKAAGVQLTLEVKVPSLVHRSREMRVDGAALHEGRIYALVETKRPGRRPNRDGSRQHTAYRDIETIHGVPTIWCTSLEGIPQVVSRLCELRDGAQVRAH